VDACISGHIKLEHVITCTFGCTNGEMHVESFSDDKSGQMDRVDQMCLELISQFSSLLLSQIIYILDLMLQPIDFFGKASTI
jgi:hypothetical protein